MSRGLPSDKIVIPFTSGLAQKGDSRAQDPPNLDIALDVQFDEVNGIQTRKPFLARGMNILGGGTITNPRKIVENNGELLLFTDTALYSWDASGSVWAPRGTHLAVKVAEATPFATSADQADCDRAELGGVVFYTWTGTNITSSQVYLAAQDKATGATILAPTLVDPGVTGTRSRLVTLSTRVLLVWSRSITAGLVGIAIDPANVAASIVTPTAICAQGLVLPYDVVKVPGQDSAVLATALSPATSYLVASITSSMTVTTVTKARTCDGPIAISVDPTTIFVQVVRANGTNIVGDRLNLALADTTSNNIAIGTAVGTVGHLTCAHRSVLTGSFYRAYVFWSSSESVGAGVNWTSKFNWIDTGATTGTEANFIRLLAPASRAFDYKGSVYLWGVFAGATSTNATGFVSQLQNTYFLYRDDASLVTKACFGTAGGLSATTMLPTVALTGTGTFNWCGSVRRVVPIGPNIASLGYAERAPRDITFTFDSNEARRCARIGQTLYITGGEILQYDGVQLAEVGFHVFPWAIGASPNGTGSIPNGTYAYKATWTWQNARGEVDRSTTATVVNGVMAASPQGFDVTVNPLYTTRKLSQPPGLQVWRTAVAPTADAPFYLATSADPSVLSGSNCYVANDPTVFPLPTFHDALLDGVLTAHQSDPETGNQLENLAPPGATLIVADQNRLYIAGIPGQPNTVWYSKQRVDGTVMSFNDGLSISLPSTGGPITALAFLNETLIVFKQTAIYALPGDGYDNIGGGANYGPPRLLSSDVGTLSQESVALTDHGVIFKSGKGFFVLNRGWSADYIGGGVSDYDAETVLAASVMQAQHQVRFLTPNRMLVWDDLVNQWSEWTIAGGLDATIWQGAHTYLTATGTSSEQSTLTGLTYGWDVETAWIKPAQLVGVVRVRGIMPLGEYRSPHKLRIRIAYDYASDGAGGWLYTDDVYWTPTPAVVGGPLQMKHGPSRQQCEAIKVRLTCVDASNVANPPTGEAAKLTGLGLEVAVSPGLYKRLAAGQKA